MIKGDADLEKFAEIYHSKVGWVKEKKKITNKYIRKH